MRTKHIQTHTYTHGYNMNATENMERKFKMYTQMLVHSLTLTLNKIFHIFEDGVSASGLPFML